MMVTTREHSSLERQVAALAAAPSAAITTTCYLDVDGRHRPKLSGCLEAFRVLTQQALRRVEAETPELVPALLSDIAAMWRWLEHDLDRSRARGVALVACSLRDAFTAVPLPVPVQDQIVVAPRPHLFQLEVILAEAAVFGIALIDSERLRILEYRYGELSEYPALVERPALQRDRQHGWSVTGSTAATGHDAAHWQPAGAHIDRHEVQLTRRHIAACATALTQHLSRHPVDHLFVGGPDPLPERLTRALPDAPRQRIAGILPVRATAPLADMRDALVRAVHDIESHDESEQLGRLEAALGTGRAVHGTRAVTTALSTGRVSELFLSAAFNEARGESAMERAAATGAATHVIRHHAMPAPAKGIAAITRY